MQLLLPTGAASGLAQYFLEWQYSWLVAAVIVVPIILWVLGYIFERKNEEFDSDAFNRFYNLPLVKLGDAADIIGKANPEYDEKKVRHALLKAAWRGDFQDGFANVFLFLPISAGIQHHTPIVAGSYQGKGEWLPTDGQGRVIAEGPSHAFDRRHLLMSLKPLPGDQFPTNGEIMAMSEHEFCENIDLKLLESLDPALYGDRIRIYFDRMRVPGWIFRRWFHRWKEGKYEL